MQKQRNLAIDAIKGLAIIAVALYHFGGGYFSYGYLGVDIFFVVGGYLLIGSLGSKIEQGNFNYWQYLFHKIIRLWPLIIISSIASMVVGYFFMLPDDYENLSESAIAASFFANNILQCITTKNYWSKVNLYKPLMHQWYVGVLMQAYVFIPIVYVWVNKIKKRGIVIAIGGLTIISLLIFLIPSFSTAWKFYYMPFRLFEITAGGLLTFWKPKVKCKNYIRWISIFILMILLCSRIEIISSSVMLLSTVVCTILFIWSSHDVELFKAEKQLVKIGSAIGKRSYSIYIWHQVIVAFLFYSIFPRQNIWALLVFVLLTFLLSILSYQFIEMPLWRIIDNRKNESITLIITIVVAIGLCVFSLIIYIHAGVVRNVPELGISKNNVHRNMHAEYCDRPYSWDNDFTSARIKTLVIGNSYGRDWANILYEYDKEETLEISYFYYTEDNLLRRKERIYDADIIFFAIGPEMDKMVPELLVEMIPREKLWVVGNKQYGTSNGIIYTHRYSDTYYSQTAEVQQWMLNMNEEYRKEYGNHFIDIMEPVLHEDNRVSVFTDDNMFISQDCSHLTQAGAAYYARVLDLADIFNGK